MLRIKDVLKVELQDDAYVTDGGIAFVGEIVEDFADDCMLDYNESIETLNRFLKECGIKQLPIEKEIQTRKNDTYTCWDFVDVEIDGQIKAELSKLDRLCEGRGMITKSEKQFAFMDFLLNEMNFDHSQAFNIYTNTELDYNEYQALAG